MDRSALEERMRIAKERSAKWRGEEERLGGIKRSEDRKRETRKKIWVGAWALGEIARDPALRDKLIAHLRTVKFRRGERELFEDLLNDAAATAAAAAAR